MMSSLQITNIFCNELLAWKSCAHTLPQNKVILTMFIKRIGKSFRARLHPYHKWLFNLLFQAKREIFSVKEQRLQLATDEFEHLNDTLGGWKSSRTSCKCSDVHEDFLKWWCIVYFSIYEYRTHVHVLHVVKFLNNLCFIFTCSGNFLALELFFFFVSITFLKSNFPNRLNLFYYSCLNQWYL